MSRKNEFELNISATKAVKDVLKELGLIDDAADELVNKKREMKIEVDDSFEKPVKKKLENLTADVNNTYKQMANVYKKYLNESNSKKKNNYSNEFEKLNGRLLAQGKGKISQDDILGGVVNSLNEIKVEGVKAEDVLSTINSTIEHKRNNNNLTDYITELRKMGASSDSLDGLISKYDELQGKISEIQKLASGKDLESALAKAYNNTESGSQKSILNFIQAVKDYIAAGNDLKNANISIGGGEKATGKEILELYKMLGNESVSKKIKEAFIPADQIETLNQLKSKAQEVAEEIKNTIPVNQYEKTKFLAKLDKDAEMAGESVAEVSSSIKELNKNKITIFDGVSEQVYDVKKDLDAMNKKLDEMAEKMKNVAFHAGDLSSELLKSSEFVPSQSYKYARDNNMYYTLGTGISLSSNLPNVLELAGEKQSSKIYAVDLDKYKDSMLGLDTDELNARYMKFLERLGFFVMNAATGEKGFAEKLKKINISSVGDLYNSGSEFLKAFNVSADALAKWLDGEVARVKELERSTEEVKSKADDIATSFQKGLLQTGGVNLGNANSADDAMGGSVIFDIDKSHAFDIDFGENKQVAIDFYKKILVKKLEQKAKFLTDDEQIDDLLANYITDELQSQMNINTEALKKRLLGIRKGINTKSESSAEGKKSSTSGNGKSSDGGSGNFSAKDAGQLTAEEEQVEKLREKFEEVETAVRNKTNAITEEKVAMDYASDLEVESLKKIVQEVEELGRKISDINDLKPEIKVAGIEELEKQVNELSKILNNNDKNDLSIDSSVEENTFNREGEQLSNLKQKFEEVRDAVKDKTQAIYLEEEQMRDSSNKEVKSLIAIINKVNELGEKISKIENITLPEIKLAKIQEAQTEVNELSKVIKDLVEAGQIMNKFGTDKENFFLANSKTGKTTNAYISDKYGEVGAGIIGYIYDSLGNEVKKYDTQWHTHPNKNAVFSKEDLDGGSYMFSKGIGKMGALGYDNAMILDVEKIIKSTDESIYKHISENLEKISKSFEKSFYTEIPFSEIFEEMGTYGFSFSNIVKDSYKKALDAEYKNSKINKQSIPKEINDYFFNGGVDFDVTDSYIKSLHNLSYKDAKSEIANRFKNIFNYFKKDGTTEFGKKYNDYLDYVMNQFLSNLSTNFGEAFETTDDALYEEKLLEGLQKAYLKYFSSLGPELSDALKVVPVEELVKNNQIPISKVSTSKIASEGFNEKISLKIGNESDSATLKSEQRQLVDLRERVNEVKQALVNKNSAIKDEEIAMRDAAASETNSLELIRQKISILEEDIGSISKIEPEINVKFVENLEEQFKGLKEKLSDNDGLNLEIKLQGIDNLKDQIAEIKDELITIGDIRPEVKIQGIENLLQQVRELSEIVNGSNKYVSSNGFSEIEKQADTQGRLQDEILETTQTTEKLLETQNAASFNVENNNPLFEESDGQMSFVENIKETVKAQEELQTESKETNEILEGQISLEEHLASLEKERSSTLNETSLSDFDKEYLKEFEKYSFESQISSLNNDIKYDLKYKSSDFELLDEKIKTLGKNGTDVLDKIKRKADELSASVKPFNEIISNISKNSSIKDIPFDNLAEEAGKACQEMMRLSSEGKTETEEYLTAVKKVFKIIDAYTGMYNVSAKDFNAGLSGMRVALMNQLEEESNGLFDSKSFIDQIFGTNFYVDARTNKLRSLTELVGDVFEYKDSSYGGMDLSEDKKQLSSLNRIFSYINENYDRIFGSDSSILKNDENISKIKSETKAIEENTEAKKENAEQTVRINENESSVQTGGNGVQNQIKELEKLEEKAKDTEQAYKSMKNGMGLEYYPSQDAFDAVYDSEDEEGNAQEYKENCVVILEEGNKIAADAEIVCARATTAVNKFFTALGDQFPKLQAWEEEIKEYVNEYKESGIFGENLGYASWGVEPYGNGDDVDEWYVYLNVVKDEELALQRAKESLDSFRRDVYRIKGEIQEIFPTALTEIDRPSSLDDGLDKIKRLQNKLYELNNLISEYKGIWGIDNESLNSDIIETSRLLSDLSDSLYSLARNFYNLDDETLSLGLQKINGLLGYGSSQDTSLTPYDDIQQKLEDYYKTAEQLKKHTVQLQLQGSYTEDWNFSNPSFTISDELFTQKGVLSAITSQWKYINQLQKEGQGSKGFETDTFTTAKKDLAGLVVIYESLGGKITDLQKNQQKFLQTIYEQVKAEDQATVANNKLYSEESKELDKVNNALRIKMKLIEESISSKYADGDLNKISNIENLLGYYNFEDNKAINQESALAKICDILGVEIPNAGQKAGSALKEVLSLSQESDGQLSFVEGADKAVQSQNDLQSEIKETNDVLEGQISLEEHLASLEKSSSTGIDKSSLSSEGIEEQVEQQDALQAEMRETEQVAEELVQVQNVAGASPVTDEAVAAQNKLQSEIRETEQATEKLAQIQNTAGGLPAVKEAASVQDKLQSEMKGTIQATEELVQVQNMVGNLSGMENAASAQDNLRAKIQETNEAFEKQIMFNSQLYTHMGTYETAISSALPAVVRNVSGNAGKMKTEALPTSSAIIQNQDVSSISSEVSLMGELESKVQGVASAAREKNEAFSAEPGIVKGAVDAEIGGLDKLATKLSEISSSVTEFFNTVKSTLSADLASPLKEMEDAVSKYSGKTAGEAKDVIKEDSNGTASGSMAGETADGNSNLSPKSSALGETAEMQSLAGSVDDVTAAVDRKTEAFTAEENTVKGVVEREERYISEFAEGIKLIPEYYPKLFSGLNEQMMLGTDDPLGKLTETLNGLKDMDANGSITSNLTGLANAINQFQEQVGKGDASGSEFLKNIDGILSKSEELRNLAEVLKASAKQMQNARNVVSGSGVAGTSAEMGMDADAMEDVEQRIQNLQASARRALDKLKADMSGKSGFEQYEDVIRSMEDKISNIDSQGKLYEFNNELKEITKNINNINNQNIKLSNFETQLQQIKEASNGTREYTEQVRKLEAAIERYKGIDATDSSQIDNLKQARKEVEALIRSFDNAADSSVSKLKSNMTRWLRDNTAASKEARDAVRGFVSELENTDVSRFRLDQLNSQFNEIASSARRGASFVDLMKSSFKNLARYLSTYVTLYDFIRIARNAFNIVKELDDALTEMRKVSDESVSSLKNYQLETFDVAGEIGSTALDIQNSTADWMRLGESLEKAAESAKDATILYNVSEFESIDEATTALTSISQAYKNLDKIDIVDKINNIGNNFSIATDELASGMQRASAVLMTQGNDIDEAIALITAGNAITQNAETTAAGVRTIALRIAGTKEAEEELESIGEDVDDFVVRTESKTQQIVKDYTAVASNNFEGVDVLNENGNLRDTYNILLDIAKVYEEIQETDKEVGTNRAQALVEELAGKNRSNIAASILQNPEMLESVYETSLNSENSAIEENEKYLDSLSGKIELCTNQLQELAAVTLDSDFLKVLVDAATGFLEILTKIEGKIKLFPTLLGGGAMFASLFKNVGSPKMHGLLAALNMSNV